MSKNDDLIKIKYATTLSLSEVAIGSVMHAWKIPLAGHMLSINQLMILIFAVRESLLKQVNSKFLPTQISLISATLKALSPVGKRLTPMLAILVQGVLFNFFTLILGRSILGICIGALVASIWAFLQPIIMYYFIFGDKLFSAISYLTKEVNEFFHVPESYLVYLLVGIVCLKLILVAVLAVLCWLRTEIFQLWHESNTKKLFNQFGINKAAVYQPSHFEHGGAVELISDIDQRVMSYNKTKLILKDLISPTFLIGLFFILLTLFFTGASHVEMIWYVFRTIGIAMAVFYIIRFLPINELLMSEKLKSVPAISSLLRTLQQIQEIH